MKLKDRYIGLMILLLFVFIMGEVEFCKTTDYLRINYDYENLIKKKRKDIRKGKVKKKWKERCKKKYPLFVDSNSGYFEVKKCLQKYCNGQINIMKLKSRSIIPFYKKTESESFVNMYNEETNERVQDITIEDKTEGVSSISTSSVEKKENEVDEYLTTEKKQMDVTNKMNNSNKKRPYYMFKSWNNTKEMNRFDLEKYEVHNVSENNNATSQKYHSAYYSHSDSDNSNNTNHLNITINSELVNASSVEDILTILEKYEYDEKIQKKQKKQKKQKTHKSILNEVNIVTAYHRIAKHVKNKNFYSKVKKEEKELLMDTYFDNVTSSLFENYSDWKKSEEVENTEAKEVTEEMESTGLKEMEKHGASIINSKYIINQDRDCQENENNETIKNSETNKNSERNENNETNENSKTNKNNKTYKNNETDKNNKSKSFEMSSQKEDMCLRELTHYNHKNLCKIKMYKHMYGLLKDFVECTEFNLTKHIANVAWASAILENEDFDIWITLKGKFYERLPHLKAQELSIIMWSFSVVNKEFIETKKEFVLLYNCIKKYLNETKFKAQ